MNPKVDDTTTGKAAPTGHGHGGSFSLASGVRGKCCIWAVATFCICVESYACPVHGETHIGTHD